MREEENQPAQDDQAEALMREVGAQLRAMRVARGEQVADIAHTLRIRPSYLHSLEEGDLSAMPGRTYALGFLRSYAGYLGFDAEDLCRRIRPAVDELAGAVRLRLRAPVDESGLPKMPLLVLSLLMVVGLYTGLQWYEEATEVISGRVLPPPTLADVAGGGLDDVALAASGASQPETPGPAASPAAGGPLYDPDQAGPAGAKQTTAATSLEERFAATVDEAPSDPTSGREGVLESVLAAAARVGAKVHGPANRDAQVILRAIERSWVQVRSIRGDYRWSRTLTRGDAYLVPNRDDLVLWTGNAGGIEFLVDGEQIAPLGATGEVLRQIPLEPVALLEWAGRPG